MNHCHKRDITITKAQYFIIRNVNEVFLLPILNTLRLVTMNLRLNTNWRGIKKHNGEKLKNGCPKTI